MKYVTCMKYIITLKYTTRVKYSSLTHVKYVTVGSIEAYILLQ